MTKPLFLLAGLVFAGVAIAQQYPSRPVRIIVPWPPGQAADLAARLVAQRLQESFGQQFFIENKPGAGGMIGTELAVRSTPDGYTLLTASSGPISIMPSLQKVPYDPLRDLSPISLIALGGFALVTHPSFPPSNAKEFVALVKANPDKYTFSSSGTGATSHLFSELFNSMAQLKARHVPYKGSAPSLTDLMNGQVTYTIETIAATSAHVRAGRLKAYGVSTMRRAGALPDVPSLAEAADLPGYDVAGWIGYAAPVGTSNEILMRLSRAAQKALEASDLRERYLALGLDPASSSPEEMTAFMRRESERYSSIIRNANIRIDP